MIPKKYTIIVEDFYRQDISGYKCSRCRVYGRILELKQLFDIEVPRFLEMLNNFENVEIITNVFIINNCRVFKQLFGKSFVINGGVFYYL